MKSMVLAFFVLCSAMVATVHAAEFSANMTLVMSGQQTYGKIYYKNTETNRQEIVGMVYIYKHPASYMLFPDTKRYVVNDIEEQKKNNPMIGVDNYEEWFDKNNMKVTGRENLQNFECVIYEGDIKTSEDRPSVPMKLWYSTKLEYPIKSEKTTTIPIPGKITSVLENIEMDKQPDSLFEIPSGYTQAKNMQEAMGMGGFQVPTGTKPGELPSREDVEEAVKSAKEMMKNAQGQ